MQKFYSYSSGYPAIIIAVSWSELANRNFKPHGILFILYLFLPYGDISFKIWILITIIIIILYILSSNIIYVVERWKISLLCQVLFIEKNLNMIY